MVSNKLLRGGGRFHARATLALGSAVVHKHTFRVKDLLINGLVFIKVKVSKYRCPNIFGHVICSFLFVSTIHNILLLRNIEPIKHVSLQCVHCNSYYITDDLKFSTHPYVNWYSIYSILYNPNPTFTNVSNVHTKIPRAQFKHIKV